MVEGKWNLKGNRLKKASIVLAAVLLISCILLIAYVKAGVSSVENYIPSSSVTIPNGG